MINIYNTIQGHTFYMSRHVKQYKIYMLFFISFRINRTFMTHYMMYMMTYPMYTMSSSMYKHFRCHLDLIFDKKKIFKKILNVAYTFDNKDSYDVHAIKGTRLIFPSKSQKNHQSHWSACWDHYFIGDYSRTYNYWKQLNKGSLIYISSCYSAKQQ